MSAEEERRYAPDGGYYSYQEFVDFYGGEDEWHNAATGDYDGAAGDNSGGKDEAGKDSLSRNNSDGAAAANSDENSDENSDDDYSDDSQYVPSDAPPEPEPEEIVDWFAELDEDSSGR